MILIPLLSIKWDVMCPAFRCIAQQIVAECMKSPQGVSCAAVNGKKIPKMVDAIDRSNPSDWMQHPKMPLTTTDGITFHPTNGAAADFSWESEKYIDLVYSQLVPFDHLHAAEHYLGQKLCISWEPTTSVAS
jgi:hypothetical protein